jgi:hypothetical protein
MVGKFKVALIGGAFYLAGGASVLPAAHVSAASPAGCCHGDNGDRGHDNHHEGGDRDRHHEGCGDCGDRHHDGDRHGDRNCDWWFRCDR